MVPKEKSSMESTMTPNETNCTLELVFRSYHALQEDVNMLLFHDL